MKARKKPIVIEFIQYLREENIGKVLEFFGENDSIKYDSEKNEYYIKTLEGNMFLSKYDYIIKGAKGEFYPCKPDIFEMTYEIVEE